jgi:hypothetical protein
MHIFSQVVSFLRVFDQEFICIYMYLSSYVFYIICFILLLICLTLVHIFSSALHLLLPQVLSFH